MSEVDLPISWEIVKKLITRLRNLNRFTIFVIPILLFGLAGCAPIINTEQPAHKSEILLQKDDTVGQTFLANYDGLNGIVIFLNPVQEAIGEIILVLKNENDDANSIRSSSIQLEDLTEPGFHKFSFQPINNSAGEDYYFEINIVGNGGVNVGAGPADNYLNGSAYFDKKPISNQYAFRLAYNPISSISGLFIEFLKWAITILLSAFLFVIPGWALLMGLLPAWKNLGWGEKLGIAAGTSLAIYPLILVWFSLIGLRLGQFFLILPFLGLIFIIWLKRKIFTGNRYYLQLVKRNNQEEQFESGKGREFPKSLQEYLPEILLFVILILILSVRYWNIRLVDAPLWGDSYQHSMIAQLIVNNNGLTGSWLPYAPYQSLTVHFGYPTSVAFFQWLTQLPNATATLYIGQVLNVLAALSLYPLAVRMSSGNRWAGLGAVITAGLLLPIPAIYTNWGRYAQLAGQVLLPIALWLSWEALMAKSDIGNGLLTEQQQEQTNAKQPIFHSIPWRELLIAGTILAGMALTYYRMPIYYAFFIIAWLITWGITLWKTNLIQWGNAIIRLLLILGASIVLILPWVFNLAGGELVNAVETGISTGSPLQPILQDFQVWRNLEFFVSPITVLVIILATIISLVFNRRLIITLFLWFTFLVAYIAGQLISLPGANMLQNFAVIIAFYIPVSLLLGWLFGFAIDSLDQLDKRIGQVTAIGIVILIGSWGAWNQRSIVNLEEFALVMRPDIKAMDWIRENTPPEAKFLAESFRIYNGTSAVGSDAGWWIPLFTGRNNSIPPQYALLSEIPIEKDYSQNVVDLVADLESTPPNTKEGFELLCEQGFTHIYIGQRQGKVGADASQLFNPEKIADNPAYELVYHQDRVYIFEISFDHCPGVG